MFCSDPAATVSHTSASTHRPSPLRNHIDAEYAGQNIADEKFQELPEIPLDTPLFFSVNTEAIISPSVAERLDTSQNSLVLLGSHSKSDNSQDDLKPSESQSMNIVASAVYKEGIHSQVSKLKQESAKMLPSNNSLSSDVRKSVGVSPSVKDAVSRKSTTRSVKRTQEEAWSDSKIGESKMSIAKSSAQLKSVVSLAASQNRKSTAGKAGLTLKDTVTQKLAEIVVTAELEKTTWYRKLFMRRMSRPKPKSRKPEPLNPTSNIYKDFPPASIMSKGTIHPKALDWQLWKLIMLLFRWIYFMLIPFCLGYIEGAPMLPTLSIVFIPVSLFDLTISMRTGYFYEKGFVEMDVKKIRDRYIRSGRFLVDILGMFPYCLVVDALTEPDSVSNHAWRALCILNIIPFLKHTMDYQHRSCYYEAFREFIRRSEVPVSGAAVFQITCLMLMYCHYIGCSNAYFKLIHVVPDEMPFETLMDRYTYSFFSSFAETIADGFAAEQPRVTVDRWLKMFNMFFGALITASLIGNVSDLIIHMDSSGRSFNEKLEEVTQFIEYKGYNADIKRRILAYYHLKYDKGKYFSESKIIDELNPPLRRHLALQDCEEIVLKVPFFKEADSFFISQIVLILKLEHYLPGDLIIQEGDYGDSMYFIQMGTVEVIVGGVSRAQMQQGWFFGEIALLFGRMRRTASIKAISNCALYQLCRNDLDRVLESHPSMAHKLRVVAEERLANDAKLKASAPAAAPESSKVDADESK